MSKNTKPSVRLLLCGAILGLGESLQALAQAGVQVGVGMEAHSNVDLSAKNERSDLARTATVGVSYEHAEDGGFAVDAGYDATREDYLHDVEEDRSVVAGRASGTWHVAPRRLDAIFSHLIEEAAADRRLADTANNQDRRSVSTAGFDGFLHFSSVDSLVISPRYTDISFRDNDQSDSQRKDFGLRWNHRLPHVSSLDLSANYVQAQFALSAQEYDMQSVMLSYQTELARLRYDIGLGGNKIKRDTGEDVSGVMARLSASYNNNSGHEVGGTYLHQLTDSSVGMSGAEVSMQSFSANDSNFAQVDIIKVDQLDLHWHASLNAANALSLGAGYMKRDYQTTPRDESILYLSAGYGYTVNSRWALDTSLRGERTQFTNEPKSKYDTTTVSVGATYHASSALSLHISLGHQERDADEPVDTYADNVAIAQINYRLL